MIQGPLMQPLDGSRFTFACHRDMPCFTRCCAKLNLVLTPYDVLRLKQRLKLPAWDFLKQYSVSSVDKTFGVPVIRLRMNDDADKSCPFVGPTGCAVYEDRPGACRIYPLGRAASKIQDGRRTGEYYFMVKEPHCLGFGQDRRWEIGEWIADQGLDQYNAMNDYFLNLTAGRFSTRIKTLTESQIKMFYTACYNLDEFRKFIFESTFLSRFEVEQEPVGRLETDDVEPMKFASRWLRFALFGEKTLSPRCG